MTALLVEDELHSREFLKNLLGTFCDDVTVVATAEAVPEAVEAIDRLRPELVFLDIEMQSGTGFDVLQRVRYRDFDVVFTTAYDHYAIQAIRVSAVDYLLKPIDVEELQAAVEKVKQRRKQPSANPALERLLENLAAPNPEQQTITLATMEGLEFVPLGQITRLEAAGAYTTFFLKDGRKIMVSKNLKEYENILPPRLFFRIHNSHLINLAEVKRMIKTDGGYAVMKDDSVVMISPKKRDEFLHLMTGRQ